MILHNIKKNAITEDVFNFHKMSMRLHYGKVVVNMTCLQLRISKCFSLVHIFLSSRTCLVLSTNRS